MPPPDPNLPPWKRLKPLPIVFVVGLFALVWWRGEDNEERRKRRGFEPVQVIGKHTVFQGKTMGTTFRVKLSGKLPETHGRALLSAVNEELEAVNAAMSTYQPTSELSRFNALAVNESLTLSPPTAAVLTLSLAVGVKSAGAFDVTVGPLVNAWGFGAKGTQKAPDDATLKALRRTVGAQRVLQFTPKSRVVSKKVPGVALDFSAVAKGFAVDKVAERLVREGVPGFMVEVGGEVRTHGKRADKQPWRIGIEQPNPAGGGVAQIVVLEDRALATSGDYRNYREVDGARVSHTIDPRTGRPITHKLASVSVLAATCAEADAWATTLNVLGPEAGLALADELNLAAFLLIRGNDGNFKQRTSKAWPVTQPLE